MIKYIRKNFITLLIISFFISNVNASYIDSKPTRSINDYARILSPSVLSKLELLSAKLFRTTGVHLVMVTISALGDNDIDDFSNRLYEKWGIGTKGKDEGVLVLVAVKDKLVRIEVGYGSEGYIPDAVAYRIRRDIFAPYASRNLWDNAFLATAVEIVKIVAHEKKISANSILSGTNVGTVRENVPENSNPLGGIFFILILIFLISTPMGRAMLPWILLSLLSSGRRGGGYGGGGFGGGFGGGGFGGGMSGGGGSSGSF